MVSFNHVTSDRWYEKINERYHNNYFWRTNTILPGALKAAYVQHRSKVCNTECYRSISGTRCLQEQCSKSLFTSAEPAFSLMFSPRGDWSETERERPIKMPPSFSLHSSLVSPHEFIWWQTIPTPPSLSVCTQTYTHSCISSIKMIHREAPHGWHFSKWGMMPVKSSHQWYLCQWLCFLIHACRFSPLLRLRVVLREVSDPHLQISLYHLHPSTSSSSTHLPPRLSHWSLSLAYLYSSLSLSLDSLLVLFLSKVFSVVASSSLEETLV